MLAMVDQDAALPKIAALPTRAYRFDDLRLQVDHRLQIEPSDPRMGEHFYTRLLGFFKGNSLIVKLPSSWNGKAPLTEGDQVTVRGFSGRIAYAFNAEILKIRYTPYPYCHLSFPASVQGAEIRKAVRVKADIPTRLVNPRLGVDKAIDASISDLSAMGVQLDSTAIPGAAGDTVSLAFRFWLQPNDYEVNFNATGIIRSAQPNDDATGWQCGIRFQGMRATEALLLQHLIYEYLIEKQASTV
jgi:c-di-GMP-binding flagellar brake protein YcgR